MNYKTPFKNRIKYNYSEVACEMLLKNKNIHYQKFGFDEKTKDIFGKSYFDLDLRLKKQPDFLIYHKKFMLLECKSFDKNGNVRIKNCDIVGYNYWNNFLDLYLFIYYVTKNTYVKVTLNDILKASKDIKEEHYWDNKEPYKTIHINKLITNK
jgi:hypothetical protein